jgi:hypothetical protein
MRHVKIDPQGQVRWHGAWGEARKARKARLGAEDRTQLAGSSGQQTEVGGQRSWSSSKQNMEGVCERGGVNV